MYDDTSCTCHYGLTPCGYCERRNELLCPICEDYILEDDEDILTCNECEWNENLNPNTGVFTMDKSYIKQTNLIAIVNPNITTIKAKHGENGLPSLYKATKQLAKTLVVGDMIIVQGKDFQDLQELEVTEIHKSTKIDPSSEIYIYWAIQLSNTNLVTEQQELERINVNAYQEIQLEKIRKEIITESGISNLKLIN